MIFVEVIVSMSDDVLRKLAAALVQSFHGRILMLLLVLDVLQSSLHTFFILLLEGDDVSKGRRRL